MMKKITLLAVLGLNIMLPLAHGAPAWVTDEFEITLRSGPSTSNAIQMMVESGMQLEVLERDADSGYSRVTTPGGTEGWVLTRYLMSERSAREQLATLTNQLTSANSRGTSMGSQLTAIKTEYDSATSQIANLKRDKAALEKELADIKKTAANVLGINQENRTLMDDLASAQIRADTLEQENRQLTSQTTRYWFMSGALVLVFGIILGIWLPRIKWKQRSGYEKW
jgi:SH3 domain protein